MSEALTQKDSMSRLMVEPVQAVRLGRSEVRAPLKRSREEDRKTSREVGDALWREKAKIGCPYRKPTQVDEERILRPTGEGLLRNSAKLPRNFGRRGASREAAVKRPKRLFTKNTGLC